MYVSTHVFAFIYSVRQNWGGGGGGLGPLFFIMEGPWALFYETLEATLLLITLKKEVLYSFCFAGQKTQSWQNYPKWPTDDVLVWSYILDNDLCMFAGKAEETSALNVSAKPAPTPATQTKTKDDAYDQFMMEMAGLIWGAHKTEGEMTCVTQSL